MRIPEKTNALYLRGVVLACGLKDKTNDKPLSPEDIKKIFTNYLTHETDVQHTFIKNFGVYALENTLTEHETSIAGQTVPAKSWTASVMVVNPEIQKMVTDKKLNGFSLGAVGDAGLNENVNFLNKSLRFEDLNDADELNPLFISLVNKPASGFVWEVLDYNSFLSKSLNNDGDSMTNEENKETNVKEGVVSEGLFERTINKFLSKSEDAKPKDETLEKSEEDDEKLEKEEGDITNIELLEQLPSAVADAVVKALKELSKTEDEELLEKSEKEEEEDDEKLEKSEEENKEGIKDPKKTMTKSTTKIVDNSLNNKKPEETFLNSETRDAFGRNKKYL